LTDEQKAYYIKQFGLLQSDYQSSISGNLARDFFTKSGLPIRELSHIWELSDLDRDGTLNLVEFCISFHLVVLRKKTYQLPKNLPEELLASFSSSTNGNTPSYQTQNLISLEEERSSTLPPQKSSHFTNPEFAPLPDPSKLFKNKNGDMPLDQDTHWETFSEISSISSVSLVKMLPTGYLQDPSNFNNMIKPMPIRVTPNKISAAGGYNPWYAQMQKLEKENLQRKRSVKNDKNLLMLFMKRMVI